MHPAARPLGFPRDATGRVLLEYADAEGKAGWLDIEVTTDSYTREKVSAEAAAGACAPRPRQHAPAGG